MGLRDYASLVVAKVQDNMKKNEIADTFIAELTSEDFKKCFGEVPYSAVETFGVTFRLTEYIGPFTSRVKNKQSVVYAQASGVKLPGSEVNI